MKLCLFGFKGPVLSRVHCEKIDRDAIFSWTDTTILLYNEVPRISNNVGKDDVLRPENRLQQAN